MPGARLYVARLPRLPTAIAEKPVHSFEFAPAKRTKKIPPAVATVRRTADVLATSVTFTCSCALKPAPRRVTGEVPTRRRTAREVVEPAPVQSVPAAAIAASSGRARVMPSVCRAAHPFGQSALTEHIECEITG